MKILLISPMFPEIGGVSVSSERLKERLLDDGYDVSVFSMSFNKPSLNNKWMRMIRFLFAPIFVVFHSRFDIIHCHASGNFRMRYILAFRRFYHGAKLIFTVHRDVSRIMQEGVLEALAKVDCLICVKTGDSEFLQKKNNLVTAVDIPAFIMPVNIDESMVPGEVLSFAKSSQIPLMIVTGSIVLDGPFYDLYGLQDAIQLYKELSNNGLKLRLLMVITGNPLSHQQNIFLNALKELVQNDENVMITSHIQMPLVPLFKYAKLFLRPTKTDGDALSVREALAMKCSVLASDASVRPNGCIIYHDKRECKSKAAQILNDETSSIFGCADFYHQIVALYDRVLNDNNL